MVSLGDSEDLTGSIGINEDVTGRTDIAERHATLLKLEL